MRVDIYITEPITQTKQRTSAVYRGASAKGANPSLSATQGRHLVSLAWRRERVRRDAEVRSRSSRCSAEVSRREREEGREVKRFKLEGKGDSWSLFLHAKYACDRKIFLSQAFS